MKSKSKPIVKCSVCGKQTAGRVPKGGDGTFMLPRRHKLYGRDCPGNIEEAEWISGYKTKAIEIYNNRRK